MNIHYYGSKHLDSERNLAEDWRVKQGKNIRSPGVLWLARRSSYQIVRHLFSSNDP